LTALSIRPSVPAAPRGHLLVIDDEPLMGLTIRRMFAGAHNLTTVVEAGVGLRLIEGGLRYDVIVCDLLMPGMSGLAFFDALRRRAPEQASRVVFMTGGAPIEVARAMLAGLSNPILEKPFSRGELKALIDGVLERDARPMS
jgi:CheY-like chemotaxis protein